MTKKVKQSTRTMNDDCRNADNENHEHNFRDIRHLYTI